LISLDNHTQTTIDIKILEDISAEYTNKEIELLFVNSDEMHQINKEQRDIDKTTDVLSFPLEDFPHFPLGSIVINTDLAQIKADELRHSLQDEIVLLFIHGLLHLLGFDHECDDGQMRKKEEEIINKYNLPQSLIIRIGT